MALEIKMLPSKRYKGFVIELENYRFSESEEYKTSYNCPKISGECFDTLDGCKKLIDETVFLLKKTKDEVLKGINNPSDYIIEDNVIFENRGMNGMAVHRIYVSNIYGATREMHTITGDEMLDYTMEELLPPFFSELSKKQKDAFEKMYAICRENARHSDYYDPYDNTWKNY